MRIIIILTLFISNLAWADEHYQKIMGVLADGDYDSVYKELSEASWLGFRDDSGNKFETSDLRRDVESIQQNDVKCEKEFKKIRKEEESFSNELDSCIKNYDKKCLLYSRKNSKGEYVNGIFNDLSTIKKLCSEEDSHFRRGINLIQSRSSNSLEKLDTKYLTEAKSIEDRIQAKMNAIVEHFNKKDTALYASIEKEAKANEKPNLIKSICGSYNRIRDLNKMIDQEKRVEKISGVVNLTKRESIGREIIGQENFIDYARGQLKSKFKHSFSQAECK